MGNTSITGRRILIVDDQPKNLQLVGTVLRKKGCSIIMANNGNQALLVIDKLSKEGTLPEMILLDILMPEMDGFETCRRLKKDPMSKDIPVIFLSALTAVESKTTGFQVGGVDYVTKPIESEELLARVNAHLTIADLQNQQKITNLDLQKKVLEKTQELVLQNESLEQEIEKRKEVEKELRHHQETLEKKVAERTQDLQQSNDELKYALDNLRQTKDQLVIQEKLVSLGRIVAGLSHEIRNPLNFINGFSEMGNNLLAELQDQLVTFEISDEGVAETLGHLENALSTILTNGGRVNQIVETMLMHAPNSGAATEKILVSSLLKQSFDLAYSTALAKDFQISVACNYPSQTDKIAIQGVPGDLARVLLNVFNNAFDGILEKSLKNDENFAPEICIQTECFEKEVEIVIQDNGAGIPTSIFPQVFEPFFTTKPPGSGTGLGLSLSFEIISQVFGGTFTLDSEENVSTTIRITLPHSPSKI